MRYSTIEFSVDGGVAIVTLNRPDQLNCFNETMHAEIREVFQEIENNPSLRCLVMTGKGRGFCAGQDLNDRKFSKVVRPDLGESLAQNYNPLIRTITTLEMPVICAVNGVAAGAGANIALACDIVLAARSASFVQAFCKIGLIPDSGGSWSLPRLVGLPRARGLALLGERIPADQAQQWGMIWKCVDDDKLMEETLVMARHFETQPTKGLALIKQALRASTANSLDEQLDLEEELQRIAGRTHDYREGALAFLEKRKPDFKGK
ncbi:MAG: 2-(1,2-epoxy-1,2-dihydrophenyl)acetyl-CoA isomerase PaaG [Gammaproteobacteria bacterium]